jgi:hypothetical protein
MHGVRPRATPAARCRLWTEVRHADGEAATWHKGKGPHRQRLDGGGVGWVDGRRRRRSGTRGLAVTYAGRRRRGEAAGNWSTRRRKRVSAVAASEKNLRRSGLPGSRKATAASGPWRQAAASDRPVGTAVRWSRLGPGLSGLVRVVRREAASYTATAAFGPAHPDCDTALMAWVHAWRALPLPAERGAARGARWSRGSDRWALVRESTADIWDPAAEFIPN